MLATATCHWEVGQTWPFRGSKSRNKVSVGEPAEGSLEKLIIKNNVEIGQLYKWFINLFFKIKTTFNGESLGSCIDEEHSKMWYVMWIANYVNHQIFERKLQYI